LSLRRADFDAIVEERRRRAIAAQREVAADDDKMAVALRSGVARIAEVVIKLVNRYLKRVNVKDEANASANVIYIHRNERP
jgi:hypothetical protein